MGATTSTSTERRLRDAFLIRAFNAGSDSIARLRAEFRRLSATATCVTGSDVRALLACSGIEVGETLFQRIHAHLFAGGSATAPLSTAHTALRALGPQRADEGSVGGGELAATAKPGAALGTTVGTACATVGADVSIAGVHAAPLPGVVALVAENSALREALFDSEQRNEQLATTLQCALAQIAVMERKLEGVMADAVQEYGHEHSAAACTTRAGRSDIDTDSGGSSANVCSNGSSDGSFAMRLFPPAAAGRHK